ncbi:Aste57867_22124 [Aphanomyces stellatus]|uniref:alpha-1,2-Mannosidase n=1 Tax=Aphanomyces stellatus TaxID=120398 RepID=A0A485LJM0_9STRA|nr:hypothetical protein As57867_022055 [Aphanomyces stellatus]VFT98792.1 Aste57867_22124 [Aphanomyces stellatus]
MTMIARRLCVSATVLVLATTLTHALHWTEKQHLQNKAKEMFFHGYDAYMKHAYPWDELKPLTCEGRRWDRKERGDLDDALGGFALTLIDSLSMLALVDADEFAAAVQRVIHTVSFDRDVTVSVFETTIRVVGGLLSAHMLAISGSVGTIHKTYQGELLDLAVDVGTRLLPAFNTKTGIPHGVMKNAPALTCPAAAGSLLLEFSVLSRLSDIPDFEEAAKDAVWALWDRRSPLDLLGSTINVHTGEWVHTHTGIGAGLDSFYEYLMKYYIMSGDADFFDMFNRSYVSIEKHVLHAGGYHVEVDMALGMKYVHSGRVSALQAFWPGLQVLAGDIGAAVRSHHQLFDLWNEFGALPELYDTAGAGGVIHWAQHYPLRPELAESTYHLYASTKDERYLKIGRKLLHDIEATSRVSCGYAAVANVHDKRLEDRMDSFFLSETVKYLFLLFSNDTSVLIPKRLDNHAALPASHVLFTTEGHLFPVVPSLYQDATANANKRKHRHGHRMCQVPHLADAPRASKNAHLDAAVTVRVGDVHLMTVAASPAQFGYALSKGRVDGALYANLDVVQHACGDLDHLGDAIAGKIVLVNRGNCSFTRKALLVQKAGGIAVIAVNSKGAHQSKKPNYHRLYSLSDDGTGDQVTIPVVMISRMEARQVQDAAAVTGADAAVISLSMLLT